MATQVSFRSGTLLLQIPCKVGVLLITDRRLQDPAGNFTDDETKLVPCSPEVIRAVTGRSVLTHTVEEKLVVGWELRPLLDAHLARGFQVAQPYWAELFTTVKKSLQQYSLELGRSLWPSGSRLRLFQGLFTFCHGTKGIASLSFAFRVNVPPGDVAVPMPDDCFEAQLGNPAPSSFEAWGHTDVVDRILNASEAEYAALRQRPAFAKMIQHGSAALTLSEALEVGAALVRATHDGLGANGPVGKTTDAMLLRPGRGWEWLHRDAEAR